MNKQGLSLVVTTLILVMLVFVAIGIVWAVVSNLINDNLDQSEACFNIFDKVSINSLYTCNNYSVNKLQFAIEIGDAEIDEILVSVANSGQSKNFKIKSQESIIQYLTDYTGGNSVKLPGKNEGKTYFFNSQSAGFTDPNDPIKNIKIAPIIEGYQCDVSDTLDTIDNCMSLLSN